MEIKKFRSRNDETVRLASTSGHILLIGSEWVKLATPEQQSMAYAAGCISEDMLVNKEVEKAVDTGLIDQLKITADTKEKIREAIQVAIDNNKLDAFTVSGRPKIKYMREYIGGSVPNHLLDEVWNDMADKIPVAKAPVEELKNDIT